MQLFALWCAAVKAVCSEYRIHNADVHLKEDCDVDDLVDCIEGSRVYIPCIYVLNKIDQVRCSIHPCSIRPILRCLVLPPSTHRVVRTPTGWANPLPDPYRVGEPCFATHTLGCCSVWTM